MNENDLKSEILSLASEQMRCSEEELDEYFHLMASWCSEKLSDLNESISRIKETQVEELKEKLFPEFSMPLPAHAIIRAYPELMKEEVDYDSTFVCEGYPEYTFSSVGKFDLIQARITHIAYEKTIFYLSENYEKEPLCKAKTNSLSANTYWIGLTVNPSLKGQKLRFYVDDIPGIDTGVSPATYLHHWYTEDAILELEFGIDEMEDVFKQNCSKSVSAVEDYILYYYNNNFLTVKFDKCISQIKRGVPREFSTVFSTQQLGNLDQLIWLKIIVPPKVDTELFEKLRFSLNAFPVLQRKLVEQNLTPSEAIHLSTLEIPSDDNLDLLGVEKIFTNTTNYFPRSTPFLKEEDGKYWLSKADSVNFSNKNSNKHYLTVFPIPKSETLYLHYWGFQKTGEQTISIGNTLRLVQRHTFQKILSPKIEKDSIVFLTAPIHPSLLNKSQETLPALKKYLLTRNRLVTKEDFKSAAWSIMGNLIEAVKIKRGVVLDTTPVTRLKETIDLILIPSSALKKDKEDLFYVLKKHLETIIALEAKIDIPIRVLIEFLDHQNN